MVMSQKLPERFVPGVALPFGTKAITEPIAKTTERAIIDQSPNNRVELRYGALCKSYDCVGADSGKKTGEFVVVRYSADARISILMPDAAAIWKTACGTALRWFKDDVRKAAKHDTAIRAFVVSHPDMEITI